MTYMGYTPGRALYLYLPRELFFGKETVCRMNIIFQNPSLPRSSLRKMGIGRIV